MEAAAWACLISPLAGALLITLAGTRIPRRVAGYISTLSVAVSFVASVIVFFALHDRPTDDRIVLSEAWTWLAAGDFRVPLDILIDPLSVFMMLIVSGVGALIVAYSIGYMDGDDEERRYFAYMSLFVFSMLLLVQSANFVVLLVGWGLVGLSSYLLIGHHHERPSAVAKSAQIPLHTWLPDAMEGPTPVSALIHAATMVTAGVYMLVRLHPIFEAAPEVQDLAAGIGAATLVVAGLIALVQTDIKRVIAYSTMSQIGYMFLGAGLGAYVGGMFHLMTHAFFKALLFLAAGIVIHTLAGEQDMRNMGGLRRFLPRTRLTFLVGSLALAGIPPLSGFWSKDSILGSALAEGWYGRTLLVVGLAGVFLTGLYTFRMFFLVFEGDASPFAREHVHAHGHGEGPFSMTSVVGVLAVLAAVGGLIAIPGLWNLPLDWLGPVAEPLVEASALQDYIVSAISVALALAGIGVAWAIYGTGRLRIPRVAWLQRLFEEKFYFDEAYDLAFYRPAAATARGWSRFFERPVIQGSIDAVAGGTRRAGGTVSHTQTGLVRSYALALAFGVAVLILVFVSVRQ